MKNPLVSIIIPVFNRRDVLSQTIESIINQSYANWECLIIDDGSIDDTQSIANHFILKDSRIQFYKRPKNKTKGANACRNYGFEISMGDFVNWFDSDDVMNPEFIEEKIKLFENTKIDAVIGNVRYSNYEMNRFRDSKFQIIDNARDLLFLYGTDQIELQTSVFLWDKNFLKNKILFDEKIQRYQDNEFHLRMLSCMPKFRMTEKVLAIIRSGNGHESQISSISNLTKEKLYDIFKYRCFSLTLNEKLFERSRKQYIKIVSKKAIWSFYLALRSEKKFSKRLADAFSNNKEIHLILKNNSLIEKAKAYCYIFKIIVFR